MNLTWSNTTKYDCVEFNKWSNVNNFEHKTQKVVTGVQNINKYLHANRYGGLGVLLRQFVNYQEFTNEDYFVKTATDNKKIVGVTVAYKHENKNVLEWMVIAVNPELHGKGYGTAMVFDIVKHHKKLFGLNEDCEIIAFINKENVASQTAFKKVGFVKNNKKFEKFEGLIPTNDQYTLKPKVIVRSKKEVNELEKQKHLHNTNHIKSVITKSKHENEKQR